jgi:hypothetical protein
MSALCDQPTAATAITSAPAEVLFLPLEVFMRLNESVPQVGSLVAALARRRARMVAARGEFTAGQTMQTLN